MKTIFIQGHEIKLYDSIDEMPVVNFQKFNKYLLIDSGLGSDVDSIDTHIVNAAKYINSGKKAEAVQELQNMRQAIAFVVNNISPKYLAFAALIYSIDGKKQKDLSDENLKGIIDSIESSATHGQIVTLLRAIKKKLFFELETYFPAEFSSTKEKEVYDKLKIRTILQLQGIVDETDYSNKMQEIDDGLFNLYKPKSFIGKTSVEISYDKHFESTCALISKETGLVPKEMTVLSFYNTLSDIGKQVEMKKKTYNRYKTHGRR